MFYSQQTNAVRKFGTSRTRKLLNLSGNPDAHLKIVHVAGTNGKGSCVAFVASAICCSGKKVGAFTSPAVYDFCEQFTINCSPVSEEVADKYIKEVEALALTLDDKPTPFEIITAAALLMFYGEGCEYAVIECGLGGRDDSTNAIEKKEVAVITSVSLEHTKELGSTISEICSAKSGIVKDCPLVVSALQSEEGRAFFKNFKSAPVTFAGEGLTVKDGGFIYKGTAYQINLKGKAQCYNAAAAIEACTLLGIGESAIKAGLANARIYGRCEVIEKGGKTYVLDGAHNPAAFAPLIDTVSALGGDAELVFGCLADKDVAAVARELAPRFKCAWLISPPDIRAMDIKKIMGAFKGLLPCKAVQTVGEALKKSGAKQIAVCGSFTILKEAKVWIEKRQ